MNSYQDSFSSENIHTRAIGTLEDLLLLWHPTPGGGAGGQNLERFCISSFSVHILTTTDQKALILGPKVTWRTF